MVVPWAIASVGAVLTIDGVVFQKSDEEFLFPAPPPAPPPSTPKSEERVIDPSEHVNV